MADRFNFPTLSKIGNVDVPVNNTDAANKQYVDSLPSGTFYIYENGPRPFLFNNNPITIQTGFFGQVTAFNLTVPSADETALANYLLANTGPYYFASNPTTAWTVSTAAGSGGGFVTVGLTGVVTFPVGVPAGNPVLSIQLGLDPLEGIAAGTNITLPVTTIEGKKVATINSSGGGGGGTLQSLTDVTVVEPTFTQVGTFTVDTVDTTFNQIIITQTGTGINVGDYLNGTGVAGSKTLKVIFVTTVGANTNIQFASSPASFFSVGNSIFRLGTGIDGYSLVWDNATNRWIASPTNFNIPFDICNWTNTNQRLYITNSAIGIALAQITSNVSTLSNPWTFSVASIPGFTSGSEVIGVDSLGRSVSGQYLDATASGGTTATLNSVLPDRLAGGGFAPNTTYTLFWRQGVDALSNTVQFTGTTITQGQAAVVATADTEIANKIGYLVQATGLLDSIGNTTATAVIINGTQMSVFDASNNASALVTALTGQASPQQGSFYFPLTSAARVGLGNGGSTQSLPVASYGFTGVAQSSVTVNFSSGITNAQITAIFNGAASNNVYVGPTSWGTFLFQPPPLAAIDKEIAANTVNSLDGIQGAVSLVAGTGIGISDNVATKQITITNTGASAGGSGNISTFVNNQRGEKILVDTLNEAANRTIYLKIGVQTDTEVNDGGFIGTTKYIGTFQSNEPAEGFGINFPVATTYADLETIWDVPAYTLNITTAAAATGFTVLGALFSLSTTGNTGASNPASVANIFPGFTLGQPGSDDQTLVPLITPTVSFTGSGTSWTVNIGASRWSGIAQSYTHTATTVDYALFLPIYAGPNAQAAGVQITAATATRNTTGGVRVFLSLPSSGSVAPLQSVVNIGNQLSNASPNTATITLLDTTVTPNQTRTISAAGGLEFNKLRLDGSTSGNVTLTAPATTNSYAISLPNAAPANGQSLIGIGDGSSVWAWPNNLIKAVSLLNIATLTGTGVLVDGYAVASGDEVLCAGQSQISQNSIYIVSAGAWSKVTSPENLIVTATNGTANIGQSFIKTSATGNDQWQLYSLNSALLIQSGYGVFAVNNFTITCTKYDGSNASASDFFVGQSVWGDGISTNVAYGGIVIASIGAPSGSSIDLTLNQVTATWSLGRGLRVIPRNNLFEYPIISKGGNTIGLSLGTGLSLDSVGRLQATGGGGGTPAAPVNSIQFNNNGAFGGSANLTWDGTSLNTNLVKSVTGSLALQSTTGAITIGNNNANYVTIGGAISGNAPTISTVGSPDANVNLTIFCQGDGGLALGTSTSATPLFAADAPVQTVLTAGTLGNVLTSAGAGLTPYWAPSSALLYKTAVKVSSVPGAPITALSGLQTIDDVVLLAGDRVLVKDVASPLTAPNSGIYVAAAGAWTRAADWNQSTVTSLQNAVVPVSIGTVNTNTFIIQTAAITNVGTDSFVWALFSRAGAPTLQATLTSGKTATSAASNGTTFFNDQVAPLTLTNAGALTKIQVGQLSAIGQTSVTTANAINLIGNAAGTTPILSATGGSDANVSLAVNLQGTGSLLVANQMANYLQLSGAATTQFPTIAAIGSDTNVSLLLQGKGSGAIRMGNTSFSATMGVFVSNTAVQIGALNTAGNTSDLQLTTQGGGILFNSNAVNYLSTYGAAAGSNPSINVAGGATAMNIVHAAGSQINVGSGTGAFIALSGSSTVCAIQPTGSNAGLTIAPNGTGALILGQTATATGFTITGGQTSLVSFVATGALTTIDSFIHSKGTASANYLGNDTNNTKLKISTGADAAGTQAVFIGGYNPTQATNVDFVVSTQGSGFVYLCRDTLSGIAGASQPKLALPTAAGATAMGIGVVGQTIVSNGNNGSPFWGGSSVSFTSTLASSSIAASTDTLINWPTATAPDGITYSAGVFTNSSGRTLKVLFQMQVTATYSSNPTETDSWFSYNGGIGVGTRFGQVALTNPGFTSVMMQPKWTFSLANNDTVRCYYWAAIASTLGAGVFGGAQTQIAVTLLT